MKMQYTDPSMNISRFSKEKVITSSGIQEAKLALADAGVVGTSVQSIDYMAAFKQ
ncbi:MAG: hypothetical protein PUF72_00650 [Clostridiales bacterium]|nr:hypothetical protein [Clostridiales bacterium]